MYELLSWEYFIICKYVLLLKIQAVNFYFYNFFKHIYLTHKVLKWKCTVCFSLSSYFFNLLYFPEIFFNVVIFNALAADTREQASFIWPLRVTTYYNLFFRELHICLFYTNKEFLNRVKNLSIWSLASTWCGKVVPSVFVCCAAQESWNIFGARLDISSRWLPNEPYGLLVDLGNQQHF